MAADLVINIKAQDQGATAAIKNIDRQLDSLGTTTKKSGFSFTELSSAIGLGKQAFALVQQGIEATVGPTVELAKQVRDLGRSIGATPEEASKLIQAADDMGVSVGTLEAGLKAAIRKGVEPTVDGIGKLADEYNAIQDPIARTKFLMDNFGRSGADLAPLMEQGAAGIEALGDAAEKAGLVMDQEAVQAAREYEIALDTLQDTVLATKIAIGQQLVPVLTDVMTKMSTYDMALASLGEAHEAGLLTYGEVVKAHYAVNLGFRTSADVLAETTALLEEHNRPLEISAERWDTMGDAAEAAAKKTALLAEASARTSMRLAAQDGYTRALAGHTYELSEATEAVVQSSVSLEAGLAGDVTKAFTDYQDVLEETTPEIERLRGEIEKYTRMQGMSVTVTGEATTSNAEYELAAIQAANATKKWQEYSGANREEQLKLQLAAEAATEKVVKLGEGFGTSETFTLNYTKKLAELNTELAENEAANLAASLAMQESIKQFVYQQLAVEGDAEANLILARNLGLIDEASYQSAEAARILKGAYEEGKFSADQFGVSADLLAKAIAALQDKHVTITVDTIYNEIHNQVIREATQAAGGQGGGVSEGVFDPKNERQLGGPVYTGNMYTVNEGGKGESFWPEQNGFVMDNADTMRLIKALEALVGAFSAGAGGGGQADAWAVADSIGRSADRNRRMGV
jgi:hypothetical protein